MPHAGEAAGPASVRGALDALGADRIRHGIRAVEDPALVAELAARGTVLDVTPVSNLRTRVVAALDDHPLRALRAAGVRCSISTDDPALFGTDLTLDYAMAVHLGAEPRWAFDERRGRRLVRRGHARAAAAHRRRVRLDGGRSAARGAHRHAALTPAAACGRSGAAVAGRLAAPWRPPSQATSPSPRAGTIGCASVASEVATVSSLATVPRPTNTADNTAPHSRAAADTPSATWMP